MLARHSIFGNQLLRSLAAQSPRGFNERKEKKGTNVSAQARLLMRTGLCRRNVQQCGRRQTETDYAAPWHSSIMHCLGWKKRLLPRWPARVFSRNVSPEVRSLSRKHGWPFRFCFLQSLWDGITSCSKSRQRTLFEVVWQKKRFCFPLWQCSLWPQNPFNCLLLLVLTSTLFCFSTPFFYCKDIILKWSLTQKVSTHLGSWFPCRKDSIYFVHDSGCDLMIAWTATQPTSWDVVPCRWHNLYAGNKLDEKKDGLLTDCTATFFFVEWFF